MSWFVVADIRDWGAFLRGRWNWTKGGYERSFPRNCQFTDVDASVEFDGYHLQIETKHHDGIGSFVLPDAGQLRSLREDVRLGKTVFVLYGCGACDNPQGIVILSVDGSADEWHDWRELTLLQRRRQLKRQINQAMGLTPANSYFESIEFAIEYAATPQDLTAVREQVGPAVKSGRISPSEGTWLVREVTARLRAMEERRRIEDGAA